MKKRGRNSKIGKKAQVFGMPFSVIFSIILIIAFVFVAFFAIRHFLDIKKCTEVGLFIDDFKSAIGEAWKSQSSEKMFVGSLPGKIEYVCFANLSAPKTGTSKENDIYADLERYANHGSNFFFYPTKAAGDCIDSIYIEHINTTALSNPYCIESKNGKVSIKVEKGFFDALVKIER